MNIIDNFAQYEMRCAMTDGIFRPMKRGPRPKAKVTNSFGTIKITFQMYDALGADDESVMLAILSLMGVKGEKLKSDTNDEGKLQLRTKLSPKANAKDANAGSIKTSFFELVNRAGFGDSGRSKTHLIACLDRLSSTTLILDDESWHGSMTLLSYIINEDDGRVEIACHWRLAEAIFGSAQFARVSLGERYKIEGDAGRILHRWLSAWVQVGKEASIRMNKLESHIWQLDEVSNEPEARKERLEKLKKALFQIGNLDGWAVDTNGRGWDTVVTISRRQPNKTNNLE